MAEVVRAARQAEEEDAVSGPQEAQPKFRYALVLTTGQCEENPDHECAVAVIEVESRQQAREVAPKLKAQGENPHFMVIRPLSDYLEPERAKKEDGER